MKKNITAKTANIIAISICIAGIVCGAICGFVLTANSYETFVRMLQRAGSGEGIPRLARAMSFICSVCMMFIGVNFGIKLSLQTCKFLDRFLQVVKKRDR